MPYDAVDRRYQENHVSPLDMESWRHYLAPQALARFYRGEAEEEHFYIRLLGDHILAVKFLQDLFIIIRSAPGNHRPVAVGIIQNIAPIGQIDG